MAKAKNPRGMPSSEVLETATRSIARPETYLFRYSLVRASSVSHYALDRWLYQSWLFQQADHLSPDALIEEVLSDKAAIVANLAADLPPALGANALVVVKPTCALVCLDVREKA